MQPILLDAYADAIARLGAAAAKTFATLVDADGRDAVYYVPFERMNREARLVIVGITPGATQIKAAYRAAQPLLRAGASTDRILAEAKREGAFGGRSMRPNLVRMLDELGFPDLLGIGTSADLWERAHHLLHATSVVPHAAFRNGRRFAGSFEAVLASPPLRRGFEDHFAPSLSSLPRSALYVALGPTPLAALDWCAARGVIDPAQVVGALAHPSSAGGSQVKVYLGLRKLEELAANDPVARRVPRLTEAAARVHAAMGRLRTGCVTPPVPVRPAPKPSLGAVPPSAAPSAVPAGADDVMAAFAHAGFDLANSLKKVTRFRSRATGRDVYLLNEVRGIRLVVHPGLALAAGTASRRSRSTIDDELLFNDNLRAFPARRGRGTREIRHGCAVSVASPDALRDFLARIIRVG